ncbi:DMT family transporter [Robertkochia aurantiaca]|uniref:DMT family transporter n=1 Tax=Robertkochia aurantiaca TaxID=2873700 RepID=UPI001CC91711|nr:DMT family transporter [Robertkochia sp. 3YJGBD-33]
MIYLFLSVLVSSSLFVIFKLFERYRVDNFQAIVFNYFVAFISGLLLFPPEGKLMDTFFKPWFVGTIILGVLFISIFLVMARTAQKNGLSVASIAGKMSVVIPVIFAFIVYRESAGWMKILGIVFALLAVYLASARQKGMLTAKDNLLYPGLLFLGSGIIDTLLKYLEVNFVNDQDIPLYSSAIFFNAAWIGTLVMTYRSVSSKTLTIKPRNIVAGFVLGIPNYFSIYFILQALRHSVLDSSSIFTINNVAIVMLTTLFGILLFRERLLLKNWIGVVLAIISIILITYAKV